MHNMSLAIYEKYHQVSPLLDDAHLDLDDGVVAGHEPGVELLQDGEAGLHGPVPHVHQLGPAVNSGQGPPGGDGLPTHGAGPVRGRVQGEADAGEDGARAAWAGGGAPEAGAQRPALPGVLTPGAAAPAEDGLKL